jgi:hypothetical protein
VRGTEAAVHDKIRRDEIGVGPGGLFLLEGYRSEQVDYGTGGPPRREHMYTREWLQSTFADWEMLVLEDYDAVIQEGQAHDGMSALIDLVARKS